MRDEQPNSILTGMVPPTSADGNDGDFYFHIYGVTWLVYGPKADGVWPAGISVVDHSTRLPFCTDAVK